jgi:hypothetical protein
MNTEIYFEERIKLLKEARLQMLRLHKSLIDIERENFERTRGQITSGQFLNMLLNEKDLEWLRKFSTLIVEIDEMLDLDDGFNDQMIEKQFSQMRSLMNLQSADEDFNERYRNAMQNNVEIAGKHKDLKNLLAE